MFCSSDRFGYHVVRQCARLGLLVPDEVAVLAVDNETSICELTRPSLSSIPLNVERQGYEAAALLHRLMRGKRPRRDLILIPPEPAVTRQSSDALAIEDSAVVQAVRFIREHAAEPIHIEDVLRHVGLRRRTLERRFREALGRSPAAEIVRVH
ncbi:MAG: substrate-binding domain-containing protein [Candidatus Sumerlaeota bacterium]|nr:substrate-binding domain-containing protein [Candidatus Sumerlaeota bacterium]